MVMFDTNPNVIRWASEEMAIPYHSPVDRKRHKYYPDFIVELKNKDEELSTLHQLVKSDVEYMSVNTERVII